MNIKATALLIFATAACCLAACKKNNNDKPDAASDVSGLNVINATFNDVNVYLNGNRINQTSTYYPGGTLGYLSVKSGTQNYSAKINGTGNELFSIPMTLSKDSVYSFYVAGTTADMAFKTTDVLTSDTGSKPMAKIRLVNASPDGGNFVLHFEAKVNNVTFDTVKLRDVAFKSTSEFLLVKPGVHNMALYANGELNAVAKDTVELVGGKVYTYYGFGNKTTGLGTGLFNNR
ncbi:DUF4397 domain-containing protein [Mucilaginibacter celer]|uniref:DUF4397 domain-containing protein n=1 Tax=Mucilaginibacter celer TaxID=2305508 RepID=A0A494VQN0_9SPHI|nr:DUF4397 domain-containing protein [Mucilaginibacter celer]AYL97164.1 DUF4397 domain-containing protein [Mucilaginibacter celer]